MNIRALLPGPLKFLTWDAYLLFVTRFVRLFAYGSLSVVLVFYLIGVGLRAPPRLLKRLRGRGDRARALGMQAARPEPKGPRQDRLHHSERSLGRHRPPPFLT